MTNALSQAVEQAFLSGQTDQRISVVALLGGSLHQALDQVFKQLDPTVLGQLVVLACAPGALTQAYSWPSNLRLVTLQSDEVMQAKGCLCCSMRSELAAALGKLFLDVLRRHQPIVVGVIVVTKATDASALAQTLKHAPFLGQRYRLVGCLPLNGSCDTLEHIG